MLVLEENKEDGLEVWLSENVSKVLVWVFVIALGCIFLATLAYFGFFLGSPLSIEPATLGQAGDYFGGILNPTLSFLSVFALLVALVLQTRELRLSRTSVEIANKELALSRHAQAESAKALELQNKAIHKQSFEQTFFAWLGTYRQILGEVQEREKRGREALKDMWQRELSGEYISGWDTLDLEGNSTIPQALVSIGINSLNEARVEHYPVISRATGETWGMLYQTFEIQLDSLYRVLYRLLKWIDGQPAEFLSDNDKWLYVGIVRSQLSWIEMVFLFYNGMSARGAKFKPLIERYALFDNLTIHSDKLLTILKECPMDSTGYAPGAYNSDLARGGRKNRGEGAGAVK